MASTCSQPIAHSYPHTSIVELGFQFSKPPPSMNGRHFQAPPAVGQSLPPACAAELSEDGEIFDSYDDDNLSSPSRIRTPPEPLKRVIDLTRDATVKAATVIIPRQASSEPFERLNIA
jgi:hypothetical protein